MRSISALILGGTAPCSSPSRKTRPCAVPLSEHPAGSPHASLVAGIQQIDGCSCGGNHAILRERRSIADPKLDVRILAPCLAKPMTMDDLIDVATSDVELAVVERDDLRAVTVGGAGAADQERRVGVEALEDTGMGMEGAQLSSSGEVSGFDVRE